MTKLALSMIVKNEQTPLDFCLESVQGLFDQIVVVDTGSTDNTKQVAEKYGAEVYDFAWCDDFAAARNYGIERVRCPYFMFLDADDVLLPPDLQKLKDLKPNLTADIYICHYNYAQDGFCNCLTPNLYRERIMKSHLRFKYRIHECVPLHGQRLVKTDISITHTRKHINSARNIQMLEQAIKLDRDVRYVGYLAREYKDIGRIREAYGLYNEFVATPGWEHNDDTIQAKTNLLELKQKLGLLTQDDKVELALWSAKRANDRCDSLDVRTRGMVKSP